MLALGLLSGAAMAQEADLLPDVGDRNDGTGIHAGSFWMMPTLETGTFFDSNVKAESGDGEDGWGGYVRPRVELDSDWGRHALNIALEAEHFRYFDGSDQDRTTARGEAEARIDIQRDLVFLTGVKGGVFEEQVGDFNTSILADEPTRHREFETWATLNKAFNRLSVSVGGAYSMADYDDVSAIVGGDVDQDFRDGDGIETGGRVSYLFSPGYRVFTDFRYNWRFYDSGSGESEGWRGLAGVEFELSRLVRGEAGVGYMQQYFDDGPDSGGISYHAGLIWNPTPLMTVSLDADREIADSALAGSSGVIEDSAKLRIDYEVLRALVLSPSVEITHVDYLGSSAEGFSYDLGLQLDYTVNRFMSVGVSYVYTNSDFDGAALGVDDYERHVIGAYAQARF